MAAIPVKPEHGPTLGTLLAPWWHAASARTRRLVIVAAVASAAGVVALVLTLLNVNYSHGGPVPFSFSYRGLYRVAPDPGGYIKIQKRSPHGRLLYSFAVDSLTVPPYTGEQSAALPLYAASYIRARRRLDPSWVLRGEGKTRVNTVPAYDVLYTTVVEGREMYGRDVFLLQQHPGARRGVDIVMLTAPGASKQIDGPMEIATSGTLLHPLRSLSLG